MVPWGPRAEVFSSPRDSGKAERLPEIGPGSGKIKLGASGFHGKIIGLCVCVCACVCGGRWVGGCVCVPGQWGEWAGVVSLLSRIQNQI